MIIGNNLKGFYLQDYLMNIIVFDTLIQNRVQTNKNSQQVIKVINQLSNNEYVDLLVDYFTSIINGNNVFNKMLIAKFLTIPRFAIRKNHKKKYFQKQ